MAKITWSTTYDILYFMGADNFKALSGSYRLIRFGGYVTGLLFFQGTTGGNSVLIPASNISYARVSS